MTVRVELDTRKLDRLLRESPGKADKVVRDWTMTIAGDWAHDVLVETGALRNSIVAESGKKVGPFTYRVQDGVEYGIYQEFGTSRMAAHPALVPAIERDWRGFVDAFKRLFE